jgi:hypothetical protein
VSSLRLLQLNHNDQIQCEREEALYNSLTAYSKCIATLASNEQTAAFINSLPVPRAFATNFTRFQQEAALEQKQAQERLKAEQEAAAHIKAQQDAEAPKVITAEVSESGEDQKPTELKKRMGRPPNAMR